MEKHAESMSSGQGGPPTGPSTILGRIKNFFRRPTATQPLTDSDTIDKVYKKHRWSVMATITLGYGMMYTTRLPLSVVKKPLIDGGIFSAEQLGVIGSGLFYGYAFGKCVNGFLADHANLRRFFAAGILGSAFVNIVMGFSPWLWLWTAFWALNGWFQGFGAPSSAVALSNWFTKSERGTFYGIWSTSHSIGEGITFVGTAAVVSWLGWRFGFFAPGFVGILVAIGVYFFMKSRPDAYGLPPVTKWKGEPAQLSDSTGTAAETRKLQLELIKMPVIWILGLASAMMYVTRYAINSWGVLYLQEAKGYSLLEAGAILGANTLAGLGGCVIYGLISDRLFSGRRPPVTFLFGIIEIISLAVIFFMPPGNSVVLTTAFVVYGFTLSGLLATLGGLFAIDITSKKTAGAAMGMIGIFSYIGAAIQEKISGHLIGAGTTMVDGVRTYDFSSAVTFWLGASILSLIFAASLWRVSVRD